jgi:hypothetical protein
MAMHMMANAPDFIAWRPRFFIATTPGGNLVNRAGR